FIPPPPPDRPLHCGLTQTQPRRHEDTKTRRYFEKTSSSCFRAFVVASCFLHLLTSPVVSGCRRSPRTCRSSACARWRDACGPRRGGGRRESARFWRTTYHLPK